LCIHCVYIVYTLCIHCVYIVYTLCIHCVYIKGTDKLITSLHPQVVKNAIENIVGKLLRIQLAGQSLKIYSVSVEQKFKCKSL